ncbi:MAG: alpha/beta hydrolase [Thermoanaerobacteraceae bacterium]|nr:alpha/beta hydrolase [Thermoanaerobacteraceae bacterium]
MAVFNSKDVKIYYEESGNPEGEPIIFVNGVYLDSLVWSEIIQCMEDEFRIITYDLRGQGLSDKPDEVYYTRQHVKDLIGLMDHMGLEYAHLVGLFNGGAIAQSAAIDYPEKVRSLALIGSYSHTDRMLMSKIKSWISTAERAGWDALVDVAFPYLWGATYLEDNHDTAYHYCIKNKHLPVKPFVNLLKGSMAYDRTAELYRINAPTIVLCGSEDILTPVMYSKILSAGINNSKLHVMPQTGHLCIKERSEEVYRLIKENLLKKAMMLK